MSFAKRFVCMLKQPFPILKRTLRNYQKKRNGKNAELNSMLRDFPHKNEVGKILALKTFLKIRC